MNHHLMRPLMITVCGAIVLSNGVCQAPKAKSGTAERGSAAQMVSRVPPAALPQLSESLRQLVSKVSPAVVQIEVSGFGPAEGSDRRNAALIVRQHAIGAGVIVDPDGYIMTNAHVVEGAQRIRVTLTAAPATPFDVSSAGKTRVLDAKVIGTHKEADLALLKVEASNLPALRFRLDHAQPGELVFAIGSPEGLENSATMGIVSAAWRQPDPDSPMVYLQTDAPINPGNSGGPLVDVTGAVVGLNTFILTSGGGSQGLGFAVPAPIVHFIYQSLRKYGHVHHTEIGAVAQTVTPTMAEGLGLAQKWGVLIADVSPGGPADTVGIRPGDLVLAVDGRSMLGLPGFAAALYQHPPNEVLRIDVLRGTEKLSFNVQAAVADDRMDQLVHVADPMKSHIETLGVFGMNFDAALRPLPPYVRGDTGVVVVGQAPGFSSANTGLRVGDVIHSLNRTPVASIEQLRSAANELKPGDSAVLRIERDGQFQYLAFEME